MTMRFGHLLAGAVALAGAPGWSAGAQAPETAGQDRLAQYVVLAELPPLEGVWQPDWSMVTRLRAAEAAAPLTPEARERLETFQAAKERGENLQTEGANCMPVGVPNAMRYPYPVEFIYSPGVVNIVIETHSQVRRIHTDGRALPDDPDLLFNGTSIGRWEGEALVVETIGLSPQISLIEGIHPTENTRIEERIYLESPERMMIETTITDPALFTEPFKTELAYGLERDWELREYICQENNRDAADEQGRPSMDLGFDDPEFDGFEGLD